MTRARWLLLALTIPGLVAGADPDDGIDRSRGLSPSAHLENHALMQRGRAEGHHASDGGGRAWLERIETRAGDVKSVPASGLARFHLVYEAGPLGVASEGKVVFEVSPFFGWAVPQDRHPHKPGYTRVSFAGPSASGGAKAAARGDAPVLPVAAWKGRTLEITLPGRGLAPGERVRVVYGAGEGLARVDPLREREERLWFWVDGDGDGVAKLIDASPRVDVDAGPPARVHVVVPSVARPGDEVTVRVSVLDRLGSTGIRVAGRVRLESGPGLELPTAVSLEAGDEGRMQVTGRVTSDGVLRVSATLSSPSLRAPLAGVSNPLVIAADPTPLYWGDLHGHSQLSDGTGTPEDYFAYARDVAGLDAVALTDHDHWGVRFLDETPAWWQRIRRAVDEANEPGRFVAVLGYEWTSWLHGHRHVLYFSDADPDAGGEGLEIFSAVDPRYQTPVQLWDALRGRPVLTFAHHSAGGPVATNWRYPPDPVLEPVTEIASYHGSSESEDTPRRLARAQAGNFVRDVLDDGVRLGFIGSGDSHDGHPGTTHLAGRNGGGLAGIYARSLTREGIREALTARRAYATNGPRIVLETTLDGRPMGSTMEGAGGPSRLLVRAVTEAPVVRVDWIRSGEVEALPFEGGRAGMEVEVDHVVPALAAGEYGYVRVVQRDGGAAWASPFFGPEAPAE